MPYSETLMDHFTSPRNTGAMESPDAVGLAGTVGRGAFMLIYLKRDGDRIRDARFQTHGCGPTIASGSVLTELIVGRSIGDCMNVTGDDVVEGLDGVPPDKLHCPALAIAALRDALGKLISKTSDTSE